MSRPLTEFATKLTREQIEDLAKKYDYDPDPTVIKGKGYLSYDEFYRIARWKSRRPERKYEKNTRELVEGITRSAFSTENEKDRVTILTQLNGVGYPVASTLLHFGFDDTYPIIDRMVLKSLWGIENPSYTFNFWWEYTETCRKIAEKHNVTVRILDKALWVYRDSVPLV